MIRLGCRLDPSLRPGDSVGGDPRVAAMLSTIRRMCTKAPLVAAIGNGYLERMLGVLSHRHGAGVPNRRETFSESPGHLSSPFAKGTALRHRVRPHNAQSPLWPRPGDKEWAAYAYLPAVALRACPREGPPADPGSSALSTPTTSSSACSRAPGGIAEVRVRSRTRCPRLVRTLLTVSHTEAQLGLAEVTKFAITGRTRKDVDHENDGRVTRPRRP